MSFKENLELIVDQFDDDVYKDPGVFYCSPDHLDAIKHNSHKEELFYKYSRRELFFWCNKNV